MESQFCPMALGTISQMMLDEECDLQQVGAPAAIGNSV